MKITDAEKKALKGRGLLMTRDTEHFIARIITVDGVYVYAVFSAYRSTGTHFITASFATENEYLYFLKEIRSKTVLRRRVPYNADSRICTLVTCTNVVGMEDERYVLHGILKKIVLYG